MVLLLGYLWLYPGVSFHLPVKSQLLQSFAPGAWATVGCFTVCASPSVSLHSCIHLPTEPLCTPSLPLCLHHSNSHLRSPLFFHWPPPSSWHTHTHSIPPPFLFFWPLISICLPLLQFTLTSSSSWARTALSHSPMPLCSLTSNSFPLHQHHHRN